MPVITMSGNIASGAREVGQAVAQELGIDFVDQQLMVSAAQRCGVTVGTVAEHDERRGGFRERMSGLLRTVLERSAASGADPLTGATGLEAVLSRTYADMAAEEPQLSDSLYLETMTVLIRELAARGEVVILGRGSQMLLTDMPHALHVLCVAPRKLRASRLAERDELGHRRGDAPHGRERPRALRLLQEVLARRGRGPEAVRPDDRHRAAVVRRRDAGDRGGRAGEDGGSLAGLAALTIRVEQLVVIISAVSIAAFIAVGGLIVWSCLQVRLLRRIRSLWRDDV